MSMALSKLVMAVAALAHHFGGGRGDRHGGRDFDLARTAAISPGNIRNALNSLTHHGALRGARILGSAMARAQLAAGATVGAADTRTTAIGPGRTSG